MFSLIFLFYTFIPLEHAYQLPVVICPDSCIEFYIDNRKYDI